MGMQNPGGWPPPNDPYGAPPGGGGGAGWGPPPGAPPPGGYGGPPPPGGGGFGYGGPPPGYGPGASQSASGTAIAALIMAIASWVFCGCFTSLPAVFMARSELASIERGEAPMAGKGIAQAAFWVAVVNVGLTVVVVGIYLVMFLIVGVSSI